MTDQEKEIFQLLQTIEQEVNEIAENGFPDCVGCGHCCIKRTCPVGIHHYKLESPQLCPALYRTSEGQFRCKLASVHPDLLYIGAGCPATLLNTRRENMILRLSGQPFYDMDKEILPLEE